MIHDFITGLFVFASIFGFGGQTFGAFSDPFLSIQLAASPQSGYILQTDGTNNSWVAAGAGSGEANTASSLGTGRNIFDSKSGVDLRFNTIAAGSNVTLSTTTDANTIVISSTGGGGGGSGNVATSTTETAGALAYWTSTGATPATLGNVATTTLTASSPLSLSATVWKVGGSNSILSLDTSGTWTGNAGTATALASNGSNCSAGNFPLGVDASGAVESCTDAWTEAENTSAAYLNLTSLGAISKGFFFSTTSANFYTASGLSWSTTSADVWGATKGYESTLTFTWPLSRSVNTISWSGLATTSQPSSSQLLVSNGTTGIYGASTSTLSATSPLTGSFVQVGSGGSLGIQNAAADGSTKGAASFTAADFNATTGNISIDYTNGQAASAANKGFLTSTDWSLFNNKVSTTSIDTISEVETLWGSINVLTETEIDASSELLALMDDETGTGSLVFASSPSITSPTLSTFFGTPCTGQNFLQDISDTGAFTCGAATGGAGGDPAWATTSPYTGALVLYPADQTNEDVVFGSNSGSTTTAPFWWDVSATSTYIGNGGTGSSTVQLGASAFEWLFGTNSSDNKFYISSSTVESGLTVNPALTIDKNLKVTFANASSTILSATTLCISTDCKTAWPGGLSDYDAFSHPSAGVSATTSQMIFNSASSTFSGGLTILNANATNATTTTFYNSGQTRLGALSNSLVLSGSTGILSNFAGSSCTNQAVTALSAAGAATCSTITSAYVDSSILTTSTAIDIDQINGDTSDDDDLDVAAGGTGVSTLTGLVQGNGTSDFTAITDSSTVGQILRVTGASTYAWGAIDLDDTDAFTGTLPASAIEDSYLLNNGDVGTGTFDFGGATAFEIVNGTNPTVDAIGEFALDTTANQLLIATSTNASFPAVIPTEQVLFSATIGSTTPEFISSGTIPISKFLSQGREITRLECFVTGGTSKVINVTDGTNDTETVTCGTTATADNSVDTNPTFTANELWYIEFGATTGTVNYVTVTGYGRLDRQ